MENCSYIQHFLADLQPSCDLSMKVDIKSILLLRHGLVTIKEDVDTLILHHSFSLGRARAAWLC